MKNLTRFSIAVFATCLWALPAFATEYCADKDHDMHADANSPDDCVAPVNPKTGKPIPKDDCDDNDIGIHPGAAEIRGNGIDENCKQENGDAANCPDKDDLCLDPRAANFIGPNPSNAALVRLYQEWDRCTDARNDADESTCSVAYKAGKFKTVEDFWFEDKNCDGIREVTDKEEHAKVIEMQNRNAGCHPIAPCGGGKKKKKVGGGATGNPAAEAFAKLTIEVDDLCGRSDDNPGDKDLVVKCEKARNAYDAAKEAYQKGARATASATVLVQSRSGNLMTAQPVLNNADLEQAKTDAAEARRLVEELKKQKAAETDPSAALIAKYDAVIGAEPERAQEAEGKLLKGQTALEKRVKKVETKLTEGGGGISPLFEANVGLGSFFGNGASIVDKTGATVGIARGNSSPGLQVGILAGIDSSLMRFNGFANMLLTYEQGSHGAASGFGWQAGLEAPFHIGTTNHAIGPNLQYIFHEAGGSIAGANSLSRGGAVGVTYVYMNGNRWKGGFITRLDVGGESLGAGSGQKATAQTSLCSTLSIGFNFGASAPSASQEDDDK